MQQTVPQGLNDQSLNQYATKFFGFGGWKANCWLIGIEEYGAGTCPDEFCKRYKAWQTLKYPSMVDLGNYFKKCEIAGTPNWGNRTWRAMHCICSKAGFAKDKLCPCNGRWGGTVTKGNGHVALIEAMPFPAPSTTDQSWPYTESKWNEFGIESRAKCAEKFLKKRLDTLERKFKKYKPKVVITYGSKYASCYDIRCWCSGIRGELASEWKEESVQWNDSTSKTAKKAYFFLREVNWKSNLKSLLVCVPQPSSYLRRGGSVVPCKIGELIKERLNTY